MEFADTISRVIFYLFKKRNIIIIHSCVQLVRVYAESITLKCI